jgi:hypothetical protein
MKLLDYLLSHPVDEVGELRKQTFSPDIVTSVTSVPNQAVRLSKPVDSPSATDSCGPLLGRKNDRGEMVLTIQDLPELERRLRLSGWKVRHERNELICSTGRRIQ